MPAGGEAEPITIRLKRGPELVIHVVDPSGKPVTLVQAVWSGRGEALLNPGVIFRDGTVRMGAVEPGRNYRLFLFSEESDAGLVAEVAAPADGKPLELRLQPCGTIRGRYVLSRGVVRPR